MARKVISGVYKITNKLNGKVYIGQSKDLLRRFRQYYWIGTTTRSYGNMDQDIVQDIRKYGINNFEFTIIASGEQYTDINIRLEAEIYYIDKFNATDPQFGYNRDRGGDPGVLTPRQQSFIERARRAVPAFLYDIETGDTLLYMLGARAIAEDFNCDKAITSHAMNRCDVFSGKYYIIPARYADRHKILQKKLESFNTINSNPKYPNRTLTKIANKRNRLIEIMKYIDEIAPEFGYTVE